MFFFRVAVNHFPYHDIQIAACADLFWKTSAINPQYAFSKLWHKYCI